MTEKTCWLKPHACFDCRSQTDQGRAFRRDTFVQIGVADTIDFECPLGVPWGGGERTAQPEPMDGPALWAEMHLAAMTYAGDAEAERARLESIHQRLGCGECATHWQQLLNSHPPDFTSRDGYFAWTVMAHNLVNRRLGKPELDLQAAREIWIKEGEIEVA